MTRYVVLITFLIAFLAPSECLASSCYWPGGDPAQAPVKAVKSALNSSDAVFVGIVEGTQLSAREGRSSIEDVQTTVFFVRKSWKGANEATFETQVVVACCVFGFRFEVGETYLIFAQRQPDGAFSVSTCGLTAKLEQAELFANTLNEVIAD